MNNVPTTRCYESQQKMREKKRWFREIRAARCGLFLRRKYDYIIYDERF